MSPDHVGNMKYLPDFNFKNRNFMNIEKVCVFFSNQDNMLKLKGNFHTEVDQTRLVLIVILMANCIFAYK